LCNFFLTDFHLFYLQKKGREAGKKEGKIDDFDIAVRELMYDSKAKVRLLAIILF
jgi:hypothetical protein